MKRFGFLAFVLAWAACDLPDSEPEGSNNAPVLVDGGLDGGFDGGENGSSDAGPDASDAGPWDIDAGQPFDAGTPPALLLSVNVTGQKSENGQLCIAVFSSSEGFPDKDDKSFYRGCVAMSGRPLVVPGLTEGSTYGFSIFHDENSNSSLDMTNFLGFELPSESYGFSNNAKGNFGPPSWNDSRFTFGPPTASQSIVLSNPL